MIYLEKVIKSFGNRELLKINKLEISDGEKVGIVGKNGAGKSTLLNIISGRINPDSGKVSVQGSIGYIEQISDEESVLSGGERVKASIAKLLVSDYNVLILDEPTNFLDISSIEALEKLLREYKGTILLVTHDKTLINNIAQNLLIIEDKNIVEFEGNLEKYQEYKEKKKLVKKANLENDKLLLGMKISEIISKLSIEKDEGKRNELEQMYKELLEKKNKLV